MHPSPPDEQIWIQEFEKDPQPLCTRNNGKQQCRNTSGHKDPNGYQDQAQQAWHICLRQEEEGNYTDRNWNYEPRSPSHSGEWED